MVSELPCPSHTYLHLFTSPARSPCSSLQLIELHDFPSKSLLRQVSAPWSRGMSGTKAGGRFPGHQLIGNRHSVVSFERVNARPVVVCASLPPVLSFHADQETLSPNSPCITMGNAGSFWNAACEQRGNIMCKKCCLTKEASQSLKWTPAHPPPHAPICLLHFLLVRPNR